VVRPTISIPEIVYELSDASVILCTLMKKIDQMLDNAMDSSDYALSARMTKDAMRCMGIRTRIAMAHSILHGEMMTIWPMKDGHYIDKEDLLKVDDDEPE
jgi:hypothetical protein